MNKKHFTFRSIQSSAGGELFYPLLKGMEFWFYLDADITAFIHDLTPGGRIALGQRPDKVVPLLGNTGVVLEVARHNHRTVRGIQANAKHNRIIAAEAN